ncbi:MmcQ/YjbR family DNA-binding protein [Lacihabitans sp. CCS-44]|uniref:MmcQ/YjbR family DNA-binding protein n=1 Tax=Lacihabitans sp. CCS-44 TaxID=2487331 RepID=UPI0020CE7A72|nr:MmcQ/YjbR family DNA-binding protein [Lacihabitans sp. CCS-44]MCP9753739.1 MmcQ/YjbR family DNA-binding protein [Lacihabitans sp. CCS-44]
MPSLLEFSTLAISLPEVCIEPHFEKVSFRIKKKIFATLNEKENRATLKFTPEEQEMFCKINPESIFPVPNKWGKMGWTHLRYELLSSEIVEELLKVAYYNVSPQNLKDKIQFREF